MNKRGQVGIGLFIMLFIGIIVAIALLNPIADTANTLTAKQSVSNVSTSTVTGWVSPTDVNESINYSIYTQSAWKAIECPISDVAIRNGAHTALTVVTDYTLDATNGRFSLVNTTNTIPGTALNLTYVDYSHCADGYNTNSGARGIVNVILIFSAFAILGFVVIGVKEWL